LRRREGRARDLLKNWHEVETKIRNAEKVALFLDFDGTLAPIAATPDEAAIPRATRRELGRVLRNSRVHVTLISGRRREDLVHRARLDGPIYLGLYGWERGSGQRAPVSADGAIRRAHDLLQLALDGIPGVWLENKSLSLAVHFMDASARDRRWWQN
jgi:trehalose-phosphatase